MTILLCGSIYICKMLRNSCMCIEAVYNIEHLCILWCLLRQIGSTAAAEDHDIDLILPLLHIDTVYGARLVNTAASSISGFCLIAHSTPRPRFPYPKIPIFMFHTPLQNYFSFSLMIQKEPVNFFIDRLPFHFLNNIILL